MNKNIFISILTSLGVLIGGLVWLVIYNLNYTSSIGFDGPAGGTLGLSLVAGGSIFGIQSILYAVRRKHASFLKVLPVFLASGLVTCVLIGLAIGKYSMSKYSDAPAEPKDSYTQ